MATPQPLTPAISRTSVQGGWTDFGILTGVTDQRAVQLGWGPARQVTIQNPFWLPGLEGVTGNPWDLLIGDSRNQVIELTPGSMKDFYTDRLEYIYVRRVIDGAGASHQAIEVHWYLNYDPPINQNPYIQNAANSGLRLAYGPDREKFLDDLYKSFTQLYLERKD